MSNPGLSDGSFDPHPETGMRDRSEGIGRKAPNARLSGRRKGGALFAVRFSR
jgi:hypothetical protein